MLPKFLRLSQDTRRIAAFVLAAAAFAVLAPAPLSAQADSLVTNRLTQPIDDSARITLQHTVHPLANAANDRGAAPDGMQLDRLQLVLQRSAAQESALQQLIARDAHARLGQLSPVAHARPVRRAVRGLRPGHRHRRNLAAVHGFSVTKVNPGKQTLEFSGSVGQFRDAFHTQIHKYSVNGETHYANATDPQIPAALAPVIGGFTSLNNFRVKKLRPEARQGHLQSHDRQGHASVDLGATAPASASSSRPATSPSSTISTRSTPPDINGTGQTIAIINDSNINIDLVNQFRTLFGLSANPPQVIIDGNDPGVDGINNPDGPNYDSVEAYLDVEWSGAVAPNATIDLVIAADTALESGLILAIEHAVYGNVAPVRQPQLRRLRSRSRPTNAFLSALWEQAAAQGKTVMVSTGDNGSAGCDNDDTQEYAVNGQAVNGFASTPYNVAVGGTDFYYSDYNTSSALSTQLATYWNETYATTAAGRLHQGQYIPEQPWNDSQYGLNIYQPLLRRPEPPPSPAAAAAPATPPSAAARI